MMHPDYITGGSYCYIGWVLASDEEAEAFFDVYDKLSPEDYDKDIVVPEGKGNPIDADYDANILRRGNTIFRITWENEGRLFTTPNFTGSRFSTATVIPVMWERGPYHKRGYGSSSWRDGPNFRSPGTPGGNVLYMDGHVEFVAWGDRFPTTEAFMRMLEMRKREPIPDCDG